MATSGIEAWSKHFRGLGDVETIIKKDAITYDAETGRSRLTSKLLKGTKILYKNSGTFESPALVQELSTNNLYRINFDFITKPGSVGKVDLKPQAFGVREIDYSLDDYIKVIKDNIEDRKDLQPNLKLYLTGLVDYLSGEVRGILELKNVYDRGSLPMAEINKDFGEVLGPIAIIKNNLLKPKGIILSKQKCKIFVPSRPNEPLMDYGLKQDGKTYTVSAKSGTTTNTVKASDILMLLKKDIKVLNKYKRTDQYKILEYIAEGTTVSGPASAGAYLNSQRYVEFEGLSFEGAKTITKREFDYALFAGYINKHTILKSEKDLSPLKLSYQIEKDIVAVSKMTLDFTDIFKDAILGQVIYVKYDTNPLGIPEFNVIISSDFALKKVKLRTKNGFTRSADKLGVQP
jgi:hypothetical protein